MVLTDVGAYKPRLHAPLCHEFYVMNSMKYYAKLKMQCWDAYLLYSVYCCHWTCILVINDNKIIGIVIAIVIAIWPIYAYISGLL